MLKKILIGVGIVIILGMIGVSFMGYKFFKMANDKFEEHKPELRQYITMTVEDQNTYVEKNLDNIMGWLAENSEGKEKQAGLEKLKNAPDAKAAGIELGRSIVAMAILNSDELAAELEADIKEKFKKESEEFEARLDSWTKIADKYTPAENK